MSSIDTNCKCGHSIYDHSQDTGCDAKGCSCSLCFEDVADYVFNRIEIQVDELYKEINILKVEKSRLTKRAPDQTHTTEAFIKDIMDYVNVSLVDEHEGDFERFLRERVFGG